MFSSLLLTHGRQIAGCQADDAIRKAGWCSKPAQAPRLEETPSRVDRRISTAGSSAAPLSVYRRRQQAMSKRFKSGGHEQGARSDDPKAHRTLLVQPPPRPGTGLEPARQTSTSTRDIATSALFPHNRISLPAKLRENMQRWGTCQLDLPHSVLRGVGPMAARRLATSRPSPLCSTAKVSVFSHP